jgi:sulfur carrier protein
MDVMVNGQKRELPEETTVSRLLETLNVAPERVVVEVNLTVLKRAEHPRTVLKEGDQVEIVHFVGGGSQKRNWVNE